MAAARHLCSFDDATLDLYRAALGADPV